MKKTVLTITMLSFMTIAIILCSVARFRSLGVTIGLSIASQLIGGSADDFYSKIGIPSSGDTYT